MHLTLVFVNYFIVDSDAGNREKQSPLYLDIPSVNRDKLVISILTMKKEGD